MLGFIGPVGLAYVSGSCVDHRQDLYGVHTVIQKKVVGSIERVYGMSCDGVTGAQRKVNGLVIVRPAIQASVHSISESILLSYSNAIERTVLATPSSVLAEEPHDRIHSEPHDLVHSKPLTERQIRTHTSLI